MSYLDVTPKNSVVVVQQTDDNQNDNNEDRKCNLGERHVLKCVGKHNTVNDGWDR